MFKGWVDRVVEEQRRSMAGDFHEEATEMRTPFLSRRCAKL